MGSASHHRLDRRRDLLGRYGTHSVEAEVRICRCQNKHPEFESGVFVFTFSYSKSPSGLMGLEVVRSLYRRDEVLVPGLHRRAHVHHDSPPHRHRTLSDGSGTPSALFSP